MSESIEAARLKYREAILALNEANLELQALEYAEDVRAEVALGKVSAMTADAFEALSELRQAEERHV
jgi:hypothetical protein